MASVERVKGFLEAAGVGVRVIEMEKTTRTAELAAQAIGCPVGAIVKSLVFLADGQAVLVLASGDRRVDTARVQELLDVEQVEIARADVVKELTGYAIGGVPPVGHDHPMPVLMDRNLYRFEIVWAAAGSPFAVFPIGPARLAAISQAKLVDIAGE